MTLRNPKKNQLSNLSALLISFTRQYVVKPVKETCETVHSIPKETCQKVTRFDSPTKMHVFGKDGRRFYAMICTRPNFRAAPLFPNFDFNHCPTLTPVAGLIFETKNREIFLERFFWREIPAREQVSRAVILEKL